MYTEKSPKPGPKKRSVLLTTPLEGYRKHPRYNLWAREGSACFFNQSGHPLAHVYTPCNRKKQTKRGYYAPTMRYYGGRSCHTLMGEIFYGDRPVFINSKGKQYVGICHHLIEELLNYAPENLLCWLTYSEHSKADKRRRALESVVPNGNLHLFSYERLRELQDPRTMSDEDFEKELEAIRKKGFHTDTSIDEKEPLKYADWYEY